jgi:hypothetical protein
MVSDQRLRMANELKLQNAYTHSKVVMETLIREKGKPYPKAYLRPYPIPKPKPKALTKNPNQKRQPKP